MGQKTERIERDSMASQKNKAELDIVTIRKSKGEAYVYINQKFLRI